MVNAEETVPPAGTMTVAGTAATEGLELVSVTDAPPAGAGPFSVAMLPVVDPPPPMLVGDRVRVLMAGGVTFSEAVCVMPP
jgi:hypothetical protein